MTKAELIEALVPFMDETEIMIGDRDRWFETSGWGYATRFDGDGCVVINLGARILLKKAPRRDVSITPTPTDGVR